MSDPLELTTELDAVNAILAAVGEAPVADIDVSFTDAGTALSFLRRHTRRVQARGWTFNTDTTVVCTPDVSGNINLPLTTLRVQYADQNITARGAKLYNRSTQSYTFTDPVTLDGLTILLPFEEMPEEMREYVTICAARQFSRKTVDDADHKYDQDDEYRAWAQLLNMEADEAEWNVFTTSPLLARLKGKR